MTEAHTGGDIEALVVAGPTAGGKSALALALARRFGGTIVNADSQQLYADLRVLTARPSPQDEAAVPHRLYGVLAAAEIGSAERWRQMAVAEIAAARAGGRLPILVGGTGLYLRALLRGLAAVPDIPDAVRAEGRERHRRLGGEAFHAELAALDPDGAARLAPGDSQRLVRAWEVVTATGRTLADWQRATAAPADAPRVAAILVMPPRLTLQPLIARRFRAMLEEGAVDEVRRLLALGLAPDLPVMKAVGVPELARHVAGEWTLEAATAAAVRATEQYAKRQLTWFRHQAPRDMPTHRTLREQYSERLLPEIFAFLRPFRLTA
ncbi:tRNA (adenosine(37)-N6)-dimethylallyltransferase MiaA [Stella sp.]|uniref:tRNA (adenosine(37)-N6)-dimethylallyltransferase MiaA n=1 Tax=Stella sp. TaxID=2912054 RepID=UPI0035B30C15